MFVNTQNDASGKFRSILFLMLLNLNSMYSYADNDNYKYYIGIYGGASIPMRTNFNINDGTDSLNAKIKTSVMASLLLGHEISEGVGLEISFDYKPEYPLTITLPQVITNMDTKASTYVFLVNVTYNLIRIGKIEPYVTVGFGGASVKIKNGLINLTGDNKFNLLQNNRIAFTGQLGVGGRYKISSDVSFDMALKLQAISNVKIEYQKPQSAVSKTYQHLGVIQLIAGFNFDC